MKSKTSKIVVLVIVLGVFLGVCFLILNEIVEKVKIGTAQSFESIPFIGEPEAYLFEDIVWESELKYIISARQYPPSVSCRFYAKISEEGFDKFAHKLSGKENYYLYKYDTEEGNELLEKWQPIQRSLPNKRLEFKKPTSNKGQALHCNFKEGVKTVIIIAVFDSDSQIGTFDIATTTR